MSFQFRVSIFEFRGKAIHHGDTEDTENEDQEILSAHASPTPGVSPGLLSSAPYGRFDARPLKGSLFVGPTATTNQDCVPSEPPPIGILRLAPLAQNDSSPIF